jgi:hypothetical protein
MDRLEVVEKIIEWLDDVDILHKIEFAKIIYAKYPKFCTNKGTGLNINIHTIPTKFCCAEKNINTIIRTYLFQLDPHSF